MKDKIIIEQKYAESLDKMNNRQLSYFIAFGIITIFKYELDVKDKTILELLDKIAKNGGNENE